MLSATAAASAAALIACSHPSGPLATADATTKALYNDDPSAMQSRFDDNLRKSVTLDQVATLSGKLKALGSYQGLNQISADASHARYDFNAHFGAATVPVHLRLDPDGRVAAYRVDVPEQVGQQ